MTRIPFVAAAALLFIGAPLSAQSIAGAPVQFGVMGGLTKPIGDLSKGASNDWNLGGLMMLGAPRSPLRFRLDGQWQRIEGRTGGGGLACASCSYYTTARNVRVLDMTANAVVTRPLTETSSVYLVGGVGVYNARTTLITSVNGNYRQSGEGTTRAGINGGVGATFKVGGHEAFVEARIHNLFGSSAFSSDAFYDATPRNFRILPFNVGFVF